jgi:hypothetical protein
VVAPSQALATAADNGTALRDYLGSYWATVPTDVPEEGGLDATDCNEEGHDDNQGLHEQLDDDGGFLLQVRHTGAGDGLLATMDQSCAVFPF